MTLVRWSPWNDLFAVREQVNQLRNETGEPAGRGAEMLSLPVDIRQTDQAFTIEASVPGLTPEDVELTFDEGVLTIRGEAKIEHEESKGAYVRRERRTASVLRQITLPSEVQADQIAATFDNGVLTITVPRAQKSEPKRIQVTAGRSGEPAKGQIVDAPSANGDRAAVEEGASAR